MRHKVYGRHLGRTKNERTALFKNLVRSLFLHQSIETTEAKAKAIKGLVDKLINQAKSPDTRLVTQFLANKEVSEKLVKQIVPQVLNRNSGYTSMARMGKRLGDDAMIVKMSLIMDEKKVAKVTKETKVAAVAKAVKSVVVKKPAARKVTKKV